MNVQKAEEYLRRQKGVTEEEIKHMITAFFGIYKISSVLWYYLSRMPDFIFYIKFSFWSLLLTFTIHF